MPPPLRSKPQRERDRFPGSLRKLRAKIPDGAIVQARIETSYGGIVMYEGELGETFQRIVMRLRSDCISCNIEGEIGTAENPHPVPDHYHTCRDREPKGPPVLLKSPK